MRKFDPVEICDDFEEALATDFTFQSKLRDSSLQGLDMGKRFQQFKCFDLQQKSHDYQFTEFGEPEKDQRLAVAREKLSDQLL